MNGNWIYLRKPFNYIENSEKLKENLDDDEKLLMTNGGLSESRVEILAITKILSVYIELITLISNLIADELVKFSHPVLKSAKITR